MEQGLSVSITSLLHMQPRISPLDDRVCWCQVSLTTALIILTLGLFCYLICTIHLQKLLALKVSGDTTDGNKSLISVSLPKKMDNMTNAFWIYSREGTVWFEALFSRWSMSINKSYTIVSYAYHSSSLKYIKRLFPCALLFCSSASS